MIFLSAFSQSIIVPGYEKKRRPGQFYEEYKFLLKTIKIFYPDSIPVLFLIEGDIDENELKKIHPRVQVIDASNKYVKEFGIDLNILLFIRSIIVNPIYSGQNIVTLDTDSLIVQKFDEYIFDYFTDVTQVSRGNVSWNGYRQDIIFGNGIYYRNNDENLLTYLDILFKRGLDHGRMTGDFWSNVQPEVYHLFEKAGVNMEVDFNGFPCHSGILNIREESGRKLFIKLKAVPQYVLSYPIQAETFYPETAIIHYKNHPYRKNIQKLFDKWVLK